MDIEKARDFMRDNHRAVMATRRRDGRPQLSPVAVGVLPDGEVVISTRETAIKVRNLERDAHLSLCVMNDQFFGTYVVVDGTARIVHLPEAMEELVGYYRSVSGEHPDWDDYREAMERDRRVMVHVDIEQAGPDAWG